MTRDLVSFVVIVVASASAVTSWIATVYGIARARGAREAILALVLPPVGVLLGFRVGLRGRAVMLGASLVVYLSARLLT